uniref:DUF148 domain-containing protein n=1 Tax=Heterorhabditis bacteriophora TaxID=37862 RepID=A0A1I7XUA1_HETBA
MKIFYVCVFLIAISFADIGDDILAQYIELSMELTKSLNGTEANEDELHQIRIILERESTTGASQKEIITAVKNELAKEIGPTKADKAVDLVMKDLKIFEKKNKGWVEKTEKLFTHLITHDGL